MSTKRMLLLALAAGASALLPACGADRRAPSEPEVGPADAWFPTPIAATPYDARGGYPLQPGNRWVHRRRFQSDIAAPNEPAARIFSPEYDVVRTLECPVPLESGTYVAEHSVASFLENRYESWLLLREDTAGLHEYDAFLGSSPCEPRRVPGDAAGDVSRAARPDPIAGLRARLAPRLAGPQGEAWAAALARHEAKLRTLEALRGATPAGSAPVEELLRLAYPLARGARWVIRSDPRFEAEVTGHTVIRAPGGRFAGWEIRYRSPLFGTNDRVFTYYGAAGYLGLSAHLETEGTDPQRNPIGVLISEDHETIVSFARAGSAKAFARR